MMEKQERAEALQRYLIVFNHLDTGVMAEQLNVDPRTMKRLVDGKSFAPHVDTALKMKDLSDRAANMAEMSDEELVKHAEKIRIQRERWQRQIKLSVIDGLPQMEIPSWLDFAARKTEDGNYDVAYELLVEYVESKNDWNSIPEKTKAYVLSYISINCYYTGRIQEALDYALTCENIISISGGNDFQLRKINFLNKASFYMRLGDERKAFQCVESSLRIDPGFVNPFVTVFCICDKFKSMDNLIHWIGRAYESAKRDFDLIELDDYITKLESDPDLNWALRQQPFLNLIKDLRKLEKNSLEDK